MKALNHRLTLEMTVLNSQVSVHVKKNDTKNKLVVSLSENSKPYTITENMHAAFVGKKPDGKIVFNDCSIVGNTITYTITAQTSVVAGIVACEIRLYDINDNLLTSPSFTIVVDETIYNADDIQIESENEINVLDSLISEAKALIAEVEKSKIVFVNYGTATHAEIYEAYGNGKTIICKWGQAIFPLMSFSAGEAWFTGVSASGNPISIRCETPNTWSYSVIDVGGAGTFIADYAVTPFADIASAVEDGKAVFCKITENGASVLIPLTHYVKDKVARFERFLGYLTQVAEWTVQSYSVFVSSDNVWDYDEWNTTEKITGGGTGTTDAVQYVPQELTEEQQAQARANIGAISLNNIPDWARNSEKPTYTSSEVGADASGTADNKVGLHNVDDEAHNDIRIELKALADRITAVLDSDDSTLDELSEIVAYIKANKTLIDSITTSKVNVSDIINNLTSNVTNKPLSAAQGVVLKALIDAIVVPTKVSELTNDKGYLTSFTESDPTVPAWAKQSTKPSYTKSEVGLGNVDNVKQYSANNPPPYPVTKVNGKTGDVVLDAESVGARANTWLPTPSDIGAEKSGTASSAVNAHNTHESAHNDIRLLIEGLTTRLNALANSTDEDLDQMAELVAYIKANKQLIDSITTNKVSVADIVNNLTTNVSNKPLSAAQGVALKALIDAISVPTKLSELAEDTSHRVVTDAEKTAWNAKSNFSGKYADLEGKPTIPTVPTNVSAFNNDAGYIKDTELNTAVDNALEEAKENGEFDGADGYTPVRGVDYDTPEDRAEIEAYIATELAKRGQLRPDFAESVEWLAENGDTSKLYVLSDKSDPNYGYIYEYRLTEVEVDGGEKPAFTNLKDQCTFRYTERYSLSGGAFKANNTGTAVIVPVPSNSTSVVLRFKGFERHSSYPEVDGGTSTEAFTTKVGSLPAADANGITTCTVSKDAGMTYITFNANATTESDFVDAIITIDEPIEYTSSTETIVTEAFANTGHAFIPADYEDRIIELEEKAEAIPENTRRIAELEGKVGTVDENAVVHNAVGATYPASQPPAEPTFEGYDIDIFNSWSDDVLDYIDKGVSGKATVTKEILGKDASGQYDIARYIYAHREHIAWQRENYPKMYAWKNGTTVIYSESISPRIDDILYSTSYVSTAHGTVTAVNATNRSRTVGGVEYVRYAEGDVAPTVIYTDIDDERNSNASITKDSVTYNRYPLGDLGANRKKLVSIFIYANEHGITDKTFVSTNGHETKMCGLVASRILRDFAAEKQLNNPLYKYIRDNCMLIVIPVANPYGFNYNLSEDNNGSTLGGYYNVNCANINRNYDTPGWDYWKAQNSGAPLGEYAGSENETQYIMNTMVESGAIVAMSLHGLSGTTSATRNQSKYQGQQPDGTGYNEEKIAKISSFLMSNYGYGLYNYDTGVADNMPDVTSKSPSYITQCGAYGGIIEFCPADSDKSLDGFVFEMKAKVIENAYAQTINLTAMWLSDYLESL